MSRAFAIRCPFPRGGTTARVLLACALVLVLVGWQGTVTDAHSTASAAALQEVTAEAALIVRGRVTGVRPARLPDVEISTAVTVAVDRTIKGTPTSFVTVIVPGGEVGRTRTVFVGAPRLGVSDEAIFFLRRATDGLWRLVGLSMGLYRIDASSSGVDTVRAPVVAGRTADAGPVIRGDARRTPMSVSEFESLVVLVERTRPRRAVERGRP